MQNYTYDLLGSLLTIGTSQITASCTIATTTPSILDSLNLPMRQITGMGVSYSTTYTVPSGGANKVIVVLTSMNADHVGPPIMTQNGASLTLTRISGAPLRAYYWIGYLAAPTTGTFSYTYTTNDPPNNRASFYIMTLQDAAQTLSLDASAMTNNSSTSSLSTSITTAAGSDLLLSLAFSSTPNSLTHPLIF